MNLSCVIDNSAHGIRASPRCPKMSLPLERTEHDDLPYPADPRISDQRCFLLGQCSKKKRMSLPCSFCGWWYQPCLSRRSAAIGTETGIRNLSRHLDRGIGGSMGWIEASKAAITSLRGGRGDVLFSGNSDVFVDGAFLHE